MKNVIIYETKNGRRFDSEQEARDNERQTRYEALLKRRLGSVEMHPSTHYALIRFLMDCGEEIGEIANDPIVAERSAAYTGGTVPLNMNLGKSYQPRKDPIPEGVAFDPKTGRFRDASGSVLSMDFQNKWIVRAEEFPQRRDRPGVKSNILHGKAPAFEIPARPGGPLPAAEPVAFEELSPEEDEALTVELEDELERSLKD